jgi:hypothetical protein
VTWTTLYKEILSVLVLQGLAVCILVINNKSVLEIGHKSFLLSLISWGLDSEDDPIPIISTSKGGDMDDRPLSLVTRLGNADEGVPGDLAALSASSFLKASSSRSNLDRNLINNY